MTFEQAIEQKEKTGLITGKKVIIVPKDEFDREKYFDNILITENRSIEDNHAKAFSRDGEFNVAAIQENLSGFDCDILL